MSRKPESSRSHYLWKAVRRSVGEQHRDGHVVHNMSRYAAQHQFAKPRQAIGAHHQQMGRDVGGVVQDHVAGVDATGGEMIGGHRHAVSGQMERYVRARLVAQPVEARLRIDRQHADLFMVSSSGRASFTARAASRLAFQPTTTRSPMLVGLPA